MRIAELPTTKISYKACSNNYSVTFKCTDCGCHKVYRPKSMYKLTFLEGHYHCVNCKKEACYYDDDFITVDQINEPIKTQNIQLQLF